MLSNPLITCKNKFIIDKLQFLDRHSGLILGLFSITMAGICLMINNFSLFACSILSFLLLILFTKNTLLSIEINLDKLTGLGNKNSLSPRLKKETARIDRAGGSLAFLFFDIDNFKSINDNHGHKVGDMVLTEVARRLTAEMRVYDELVRYGGDEFCVICPLKREEDSSTIKDKMNKVLNFCYSCVDIKLKIRTSVGMSLYPRDTRDIQEIVAIADARMYENKQLGKTHRSWREQFDG